MRTFPVMIMYLDRIGVVDVLFPFILVFTVIFAVLQKAKILGDPEKVKKFNVIIALVMAFAVVIPHVLNVYPAGADVVQIMNDSLPQVSIVVIAILMFLIMIGIFGFEFAGGRLSGWIVFLALLLTIYIFGTSAGWLWGFPQWLNFLNDPDLQALVVIILVFGIIVWFITKEPKPAGERGKGLKNWEDFWSSAVGKGGKKE